MGLSWCAVSGCPGRSVGWLLGVVWKGAWAQRGAAQGRSMGLRRGAGAARHCAGALRGAAEGHSVGLRRGAAWGCAGAPRGATQGHSVGLRMGLRGGAVAWGCAGAQ